MKRKIHKLTLHRETLNALDAENLQEAAGGVTGGAFTQCRALCVTEVTFACSVCRTC
jgi:hypothetical protein